MMRLLVVAVITLIGSASVGGAQSNAPKRGYTIDDHLANESVGDVSFAPDSRGVAFVRGRAKAGERRDYNFAQVTGASGTDVWVQHCRGTRERELWLVRGAQCDRAPLSLSDRDTMRCRLLRCTAFAIALSTPAAVDAQGMLAGRDSVGLPLKATRTISYTTTELTWNSIGISPDGNTLIFDVLGDLYTLPVTGGTAKRLTSGVAMDAYAQYSPDGRQIAFISDRSGKRQLWVMQRDGSGARQVANYVEDEQHNDIRIRHPRWAPDGKSVMVMLYPGKLASVDLATGSMTVLFQDKTLGHLEPGSFESDTIYLFPAGKSAGVDPRTLFRLNIRSRKATPLSVPDKALIGAAITPDRKLLTYVHATGTGNATLVAMPYGGLSDSAREAKEIIAGVQSVALWRRDYAITPDSRAAILNHNGRIIRVDLQSAAATEIPFSVRVDAELGPLNYNRIRLTDGPITVRQMHSVQWSRDGRELLFVALNKIWRQRGERQAERLTGAVTSVREFSPKYSPDGQWIMWASWSEQEGGRIWKIPSAGGAPVLLSRDTSRAYTDLEWLPDGQSIVALSTELASGPCPVSLVCYEVATSKRFVRVSAFGGAAQPVAGGGVASRFLESLAPVMRLNGTRMFWTERGALKSLQLAGGDSAQRTHVRESSATRVVPSRDQQWIAVESNFNVYVVPAPSRPSDGTLDSIAQLDFTAASVPATVKQITLEGGIEPSWSDDGVWLRWLWTNQVCQLRVVDLKIERGPNAAMPPAQCRSLLLQVPQRIAAGSVVLRRARVISLAASGVKRVPKGDGGVAVASDPVVIESADVVVTNRRIVAVGPSGTVHMPPNAKTLDMSGTTIMPGIVDLHGDAFGGGREFNDGPGWDVPAVLAYGVTTVRKPSTTDAGKYRLAENLAAGAEVGPRFFNAPLLQSHKFRTRDDARHAARKFKALGAVALKEYGEGRPSGRLGLIWTNQEGARVGLNVTGHWNDSQMHDGFSGWEHTGPLAQQQMSQYHDWIELMARSGATNTPTMGVIMRGPASDYAYSDCTDFTTAKARRFFSSRWREHQEKSKGACRPSVPDERAMRQLSGICKMVRAGGNVAVGSHGPPFAGVTNTHFEMWRMVMGGCTPAEALRIGTLNGAIGLGMADDLGSIEPGKIADLIVLNQNPLEDIRNTMSIRYVMKDGIIYNGDTLEHVWPETRR